MTDAHVADARPRPRARVDACTWLAVGVDRRPVLRRRGPPRGRPRSSCFAVATISSTTPTRIVVGVLRQIDVVLLRAPRRSPPCWPRGSRSRSGSTDSRRRRGRGSRGRRTRGRRRTSSDTRGYGRRVGLHSPENAGASRTINAGWTRLPPPRRKLEVEDHVARRFVGEDRERRPRLLEDPPEDRGCRRTGSRSRRDGCARPGVHFAIPSRYTKRPTTTLPSRTR